MQIRMAHLRIQGIDVAVFATDARSRNNADRDRLLTELTTEAVRNGMHVQRAALAYKQHGRTAFYGSTDLIRYLSRLGGVPRWTHTLSV